MPCNPFDVVRQFESALCEYTGAPYAVATTSCTTALMLACIWHKVETVEIPKRTYVGVPMSILNAGGKVTFRDHEWVGGYQLWPYPIFDYARLLTSGMYLGGMMCLSFHWAKHLAVGQGGAILHDDPQADVWLRKARFDGRTEGVDPSRDQFDVRGYHAYMMPRDAAEGLSRLAILPKKNDPLPNSEYPDLSRVELFR